MAITTVSSHVVSVNAIQGTLIADNAITAVHIATNAVSGTLIADNAITAVHVAQNSITVTQLADDCVESDKIADGVITTNHLNKAMISSQTEVTPVSVLANNRHHKKTTFQCRKISPWNASRPQCLAIGT